jgi:hypothetical protein
MMEVPAPKWCCSSAKKPTGKQHLEVPGDDTTFRNIKFVTHVVRTVKTGSL